ncbi:ATP-binding cassette subfamily B protein [Ruminiclostridium sufflavum DSM 19573]|uniref:ATP-binding cassette subfamily B protein n=1 Tax=Ruminiclostridium sufflavum DSM 19573 TaxID=1121337 RepID=A0A318XLV5_9FIRM|nr:ABC transporter ATP-binding protein [Ruminiclostridium sufflavum]PYG88707.1 ATP-binding cassette subfamily B protein [Ruminiclostridium sufflavum DSM 19573]
MLSLMKRILSVSGKYKGKIQLAFVFSFLKSIMAKVPIGLAFVILAAFYDGTANAALCLKVGIAMAASLILQILLQHTANRLQSAAGYMVFAEKRMELGTHLRKMPMGYFTEGNLGKISSVLSTDMLFIEENCMNILADMMSYIFAEVILLAFLFLLNVWLGLAATAVILILIVVAHGMNKDSLRYSSIRQEQSENLTEAVLDFIEGIGIIKTYNLLGEKSKELSDNFRTSCKRSIDFEENAAVWQRGLNLLYGIGGVIILTLSLYLNAGSVLDTTFLLGIMLFVFDLFGPIKALYSDSARLTVMSSCMDRIEAVFNEQELPDNGRSTIPEHSKAPEVQFKNVRFSYGNKDVLHNVSFDLKKNNMLALVGPSGGGKSTIANLLTRFWDVKSGQVLVRGKDVREVKLSDLMNNISMVFQRVYLFQDTVYNNISMGRPDAGEAEVIEAAKKARCYDFIMALPDGFQTMIGEGGETLSGGEKQRISIARCILKDAPIVILDEATASVDADNESYIQEAISELCKGKTLLVIAHRLGTIRYADKILVIANGEIAQEGTHEELIQMDGIYKSFVTVRETTKGWSRRE